MNRNNKQSLESPIVFISYNQHDVKWAKWLRRRLEWYSIPTSLRNSFPESRFIRPVFRDRDELDSGVLTEEIERRLDKSRFLLLICSPHSEQSKWVGSEILHFSQKHSKDCIIPFIVDGRPHEYTTETVDSILSDECFHRELRILNLQDPLLGIAVKDDGRSNRYKAFIRVVSRVIGLPFPKLWKRHQRFVRHVVEVLSIITILALLLAYWFMLPIRLEMTIYDEKSSLPGMEVGVLTVNNSDYSINHPDTLLFIDPLPGYNRLKPIHVRFQANRFYRTVDQTIKLGAGIKEKLEIQLYRDSTFAIFAGYVYDGDFDDYSKHPIDSAHVQVGTHGVLSDADGYFRIVLPLDEQEQCKPILIEKNGYHSKYREDETPHTELCFLLHRSL